MENKFLSFVIYILITYICLQPMLSIVLAYENVNIYGEDVGIYIYNDLTKEEPKIEEKEKEEKKEKEDRLREEKEKRESSRKDLLKLLETLKIRPLNKKEFLSLVRYKNDFNFDVSLSSFSRIDWKEYFMVSTLKEQIVWERNLEEVLFFLDYLYKKSYDDNQLELIIQAIEDLNKFLAPIKRYGGYTRIKEILATSTPNIPK